MKKMLLIPILAIVLLSMGTPVLAGDPPDTNIDVNVSTPGDVDLDVIVDAGGDVDVTVDGIDLKETAHNASGALSSVLALQRRAAGGAINTHDWYRYWNREIEPYNQLLTELNNAMSLLAVAEMKLTKGYDLTASELTSTKTALYTLSNTFKSHDAEVSETIAGLQERDDIIWNQLMYGAEYHISLLDTRMDIQETKAIGLQTELDTLAFNTSAKQEASDTNYTNLRNYTIKSQQRHLYYIWGLSGAVLVLLILLITFGVRNKAH